MKWIGAISLLLVVWGPVGWEILRWTEPEKTDRLLVLEHPVFFVASASSAILGIVGMTWALMTPDKK